MVSPPKVGRRRRLEGERSFWQGVEKPEHFPFFKKKNVAETFGCHGRAAKTQQQRWKIETEVWSFEKRLVAGEQRAGETA